MRKREELVMTSKFMTWAPGRMELPPTERQKATGGTSFGEKITSLVLDMNNVSD